MKKLYFVLVLILTFCFVNGCSNKLDAFDKQISYMQSALYTGSNEAYTLSISAGTKESPYSADGTAETVSPFCKITLTPTTSKIILDNNYTFTLSGDTVIMEGNLSHDCMRGVLTADISTDTSLDNLSSVIIKHNDDQFQIEVENAMSDISISAKDASKIAKQEFADEIAKETINGVFQREVYIKFICDTNANSTQYYWYVAMISKTNSYWALLISPTSGDIIAKRK